MMRKVLKYISQGVGILLITLLLLFAIEGVLSVYLFVRSVLDEAKDPISERSHTQYDELLGWINIPELESYDVYGPGIHVQTNAQGFRNNSDYSSPPPQGVSRIICSGDSFTFGNGVSNHETWCNLLQNEIENLESVNMGQGGYGVDQTYLWYERDGLEIEHDIQIFAVIFRDFYRMLSNEFLGYGKPTLTVDNQGNMTASNVPVPKKTYRFPWITENRELFRKLSLFEIFNEWMNRNSSSSNSTTPEGANQETADDENSIKKLLRAVFNSLSETHKENESRLLVVYLPIYEEYSNDSTKVFRDHVRALSREFQFEFLDLVPEVRKLSNTEMEKLYIWHVAPGHYSRIGNKWAASHISIALIDVFGLKKNDSKVVSSPVWIANYKNGFRGGSGSVVTNEELAVDHNWSTEVPISGIDHDDFTVEWTSCLKIDSPKEIDFYLGSDDGSKLYVNNDIVIDRWYDTKYYVTKGSIKLDPGLYEIRVEYYENIGKSRVDLKASFNGDPAMILGSNYLTIPSQNNGYKCVDS